MSPTRLLVKPRLPTALAGRASLDLPGQDLLFFPVEGALVLPTKIDIPTFEEALSRVLQLYPHAAGRLRCTDGRWFIELTDSGVPVVIDYKPNTTSDMFLRGDWVFQDDLSTFITPQPVYVDFAKGDNSLVCLNLTFFENETSVGLHWQHVVGDFTLGYFFLHTLSQFYQGLSQEYPSPTFDKFSFPKPTSATVAEFGPSLVHLRNTSTLDGIQKSVASVMKNIENLKWRIDNSDLDEARAALSSRTPNKRVFSKQDCLTAYVVSVLNYNTRRPVQLITDVFNLRTMTAPFISSTVAGNMFQNITLAVPPDMLGIAGAIRDSFAKFRNPDYIFNLKSVESDIILETANAGKLSNKVDREDTNVLVNSHTAIDQSTVHFGCSGGVRFYLSRTGKNLLRCCRSNPAKGDDGVWRARKAVDISFGVSKELAPGVAATFARGVRFMLKNEREARL